MRKLILLSTVISCLVVTTASSFASDDTPTPILIATKRTLKKEDTITQHILETLKITLQDSKKFRTITCNAKHPTIKRALLEQSLSADDLAEPLTSLGLEHISEVVGAKAMLVLDIVRDHDDISCGYVVMALQGGVWVEQAANSVHVSASEKRGKYRLTKSQIEATIVDTLAGSLGVKSNLVEKTSANKVNKAEQPPKQTTPEPPPIVVIEPKPVKPTNPVKTESDPTTTSEETKVTQPDAVRQDDLEADLVRFRQSSDQVNVILALRRAINQKPRDINIRRQLIQAYQEKSLYPQAFDEIRRSREMFPNNSSILRLYGDALLSKSDVDNAIKTFQEVLRIDPSDTLARISLGDAFIADNQIEAGTASYNSAIKFSPKSPLPYRKLSRIMLSRAGSDGSFYASSLQHVTKLRELIPADEKLSYFSDYAALMVIVHRRLSDTIDQLKNVQSGVRSGERKAGDAMQLVTTVKSALAALGDYIDKLPVASGQDSTHLLFQQSESLLSQSLSFYLDFLSKGVSSIEDQFSGTLQDSKQALESAKKRLDKAMHNGEKSETSSSSGT